MYVQCMNDTNLSNSWTQNCIFASFLCTGTHYLYAKSCQSYKFIKSSFYTIFTYFLKSQFNQYVQIVASLTHLKRSHDSWESAVQFLTYKILEDEYIIFMKFTPFIKFYKHTVHSSVENYNNWWPTTVNSQHKTAMYMQT